MIDDNNISQAAALNDGQAVSNGFHVSPQLRCISVGSGKGGVGKTMVSINLGVALVNMGYRVLIMDADVGLANVDLQMGIEPTFTLQDVVFGHCSLEDAVISVEGGPDVLASSSGAPEMVDMGNARRRMFVEELIRFAGRYEYFLIDVGAGIGKNITTFLCASPEVLVVVANEPTSVMDAYSLIKVMRQDGQDNSIMMVVNMVRSLAEGEVLAERLNGITQRFLGLDVPVAGVITYDHTVGDSIRARRPVMQYAERSASSLCLDDLAHFVASGRGRSANTARMGPGFFDQLVDLQDESTVAGKPRDMV